MTQTNSSNHDTTTGSTSNKASSPVVQKNSRTLWIIILVFTIFVVAVFLTENKGDQTSWWETDYNAGIELAKQQNKPALICFYKQGTRFSSDMWQEVYSKSSVKKFVRANFIPILIDVDKQPELAKRYNVTYYPTHYVENPNTSQTDGPFIGAHRLVEFIKRPRDFTSKNSSPK